MQIDETSPPLVSIVIVNYNGLSKLGSLLDECLESVLSTDYGNFEVILVDNASYDGSIKHVKGRFGEKLRMLVLDRNYGYAGGVNRGIRMAKGDIVATLNTDVIVKKGWLRYLVISLLRDKSAKIAFPKVLMLEDPRRIASYGGEVNVLMVAWDRYLLEYDDQKRYIPYNCFHPPGAAFIVRRELIREFGGSLFDEDYFAYFEDVDLGWRTQLLGYKVIFVPKSIVYHKLGGSFGMVSPLKFYLMRRNALRSGVKNMEARIMLTLLPIWLLASVYASYLFSRATRNSLYVVMGLKVVANTICDFKQLWKKHLLIDSRRHKSTKELQFSSLLLTYEPSTFTNALLKLINKILGAVNLHNLSINEAREYPTFQLLREVNNYG